MVTAINIILIVSSGYSIPLFFFFFFLNDTPPPEIYPLPLHAALPISLMIELSLVDQETARLVSKLPAASRRSARNVTPLSPTARSAVLGTTVTVATGAGAATLMRSEEHTSELQSLAYLVCRLLLEKKK